MRIAIDYTPAIAQRAGIGRYTRDLVDALARVDVDDRFTLFSAEQPTADRGFPSTTRMTPRVVGIGNRRMTILWQRMRVPVPAELLMGNADLIHGPDFILPPVWRARRVVTIHDLAFLTHPECAMPKLVAYLSRVVPRSVAAADAIIAVSERTADDLGRLLNVPRKKITVIPLGVDAAFTPEMDERSVAAAREKYALVGPVALAVGTIEPRKNYEGLVAAFAAARQQPDGPRTLVIVGRAGWLYDGVFASVERWGLREHVRFLDYIPDGELATLYHAADVLAMPSLYEGFGIPVLEAMASGTPVVCSDGGSLPEVAGDAAVVVPVGDIDALSTALIRVTRDHQLRDALIAKGLERVKSFTWDEAARAHVRLYHTVVKSA